MENKILYFGLTFEKYDILDFTDDFLAGVRANYFNSGHESQVNRSVQYLGEDEFSFIYSIRENSPISWKVNKNGNIHQNAEVVNSDVYRVNTYTDDGRIFKRHYFDNNHIWIKSEYLDDKSKIIEYVLYPSVIDEKDVIVKIHNTEDSIIQSYLYPKDIMPSDGDYSILAFTDDGFLFFNSVPNDRFISKTVIRDDSVNNLGGFSFDTVDFNLTRNLNTTFDITEVEYLTDENGKPYHTVSNSEFNEPKIEIKEKENITEEKPVEGISADAVFDVGGEKYSYYGFLDEENRRNGYGRTVTPGGNTAYEGFYQNDKRNGFGTFYYKNRKVNYIGNWHDNFRDGFGVGFRSSDGTSHIGKWNKNNPDGIGARFDSDGNFIFLGYYQNGKKQGKGITLDDDGSFVVSEFKDDEVITSYKIDDLLNNQNKTE